MLDLVAFRQYLHQHPELSGHEYKTQALLQEYFKTWKVVYQKVGRTGLLVSFKGKNKGPSLLLRADIDALPIEESLAINYVSRNKGVSHKCGHDGHTTVLMALTEYFKDRPLEKGQLHLLFQPAEEEGRGAAAVLADPNFKKIHYDRAYAFHNIPGQDLGCLAYRKGNFTAGVRSIIFRFEGFSSHAAEPEKANSPQALLAKAILQTEMLGKGDWSEEDFSQVTLVHASLGEPAYGIKPGKGELHYTIRAWKAEVLNALEAELKAQIKAWAEEDNLRCQIESLQEFWPNHNDSEAVDLLVACADSLGMPKTNLKEAFRWGEDFGLFIKDKPGALFGIGSGKDQLPLHHPDYDFPDALIKPSFELFKTLSLNYLNGKY